MAIWLIVQQSRSLEVEAVKEPFGPRLGASALLAVTWVTGVFDYFWAFLCHRLVYRSWMAGSLAPVMYWAVRTTLCSILRLEAEQLPDQAVRQPARMLSMVQL